MSARKDNHVKCTTKHDDKNNNNNINRFLSFKRITIELILLNPTKFEQIRKFKIFELQKKKLKVRKLKLPIVCKGYQPPPLKPHPPPYRATPPNSEYILPPPSW